MVSLKSARLIQQKLEVATEEQKQQAFKQVLQKKLVSECWSWKQAASKSLLCHEFQKVSPTESGPLTS